MKVEKNCALEVNFLCDAVHRENGQYMLLFLNVKNYNEYY